MFTVMLGSPVPFGKFACKNKPVVIKPFPGAPGFIFEQNLSFLFFVELKLLKAIISCLAVHNYSFRNKHRDFYFERERLREMV